MIETFRRPQHGCARCTWWTQFSAEPQGRCACHGGFKYWKHPACPEYELDPFVVEGIDIETDLEE